MTRKQSSAALSRLAARVMRGHKPTRDEIEQLAACVLSQDERGRAFDIAHAMPAPGVPDVKPRRKAKRR